MKLEFEPKMEQELKLIIGPKLQVGSKLKVGLKPEVGSKLKVGPDYEGSQAKTRSWTKTVAKYAVAQWSLNFFAKFVTLCAAY